MSSISLFEIIVFHSGTDDNSKFLGYEVFSTDNFSQFLLPEDGGNKLFRNIGDLYQSKRRYLTKDWSVP